MTQAEAFAAEFDVPRGTLDRLTAYEALLRKWTPRINLVAKSTLDDLWTRHFRDSAQLAALAGPAETWADLGSGGGFPGLVVAMLRPDTHVTLVESDQRKATFLRAVARETDTPATVIAKRIEDVDPLATQVLSARALAPLPALLTFAERHLAPGGIALFPKGATWRDEVAKALESWRFDCEEYPSQTDPDGVILKIGAPRRA